MKACSYTHMNTDIVAVTPCKRGIRASGISPLFLYPAEIDGRSHLEPERISNKSWVTIYDQTLLPWSHLIFFCGGDDIYWLKLPPKKKHSKTKRKSCKQKYAVTNQSDRERGKTRWKLASGADFCFCVWELCLAVQILQRWGHFIHLWSHAAQTMSEWGPGDHNLTWSDCIFGAIIFEFRDAQTQTIHTSIEEKTSEWKYKANASIQDTSTHWSPY